MNEKQWKQLYDLLDEAIGSWHRAVDAIETIANSLEKIADKKNE